MKSRRIDFFICLALFAAAAALRGAFFLGPEAFPDGDECVVGIMAKHALENGERLQFFYGQQYGAGHAVVAYMAAFAFRLFGIGSFALHLPTALISCFIPLLTFAILKKACGRTAAAAGAGLLALSPTFLHLSLKVCAYIETVAVLLAALYVLLGLAERGREAKKFPPSLEMAFGLLCGVSCWFYEFSFVYMAAFAAVMLLVRRRLHLSTLALVGGASYLVGCSPILRYAIHDSGYKFYPLMLLESKGAGEATHLYFSEMPRLWGFNLASYFATVEHDAFVSPAPIWGWAIVAAIGICYLLFVLRRSHEGEDGGREARKALRFFLLCFPLVFSLAAAAMPVFLQFPRYLILVEPLAAIVVGAAIGDLARRTDFRRASLRALAAIPLILLFLGEAALLVRSYRTERTLPYGKDAIDAIAFLDELGADYFYAPYMVKWQLIFLSKERKIGFSQNLDNLNNYSGYNHLLKKDFPAIYVFDRKDKLVGWLKENLERENIRYKTKEVGRLLVYYDLSRRYGIGAIFQ